MRMGRAPVDVGQARCQEPGTECEAAGSGTPDLLPRAGERDSSRKGLLGRETLFAVEGRE
jgi:hypothetical protein